VETIPFEQTRNYVQRVLAGLQIYRWRLDQGDAALAISGDLIRGRMGGGDQIAACGPEEASTQARRDC
jgi:soluble lytic murein transglycosylase